MIKLFFLFLQGFCVFLLTLLPFLTIEKVNFVTPLLFKDFLILIVSNKLKTVIFCGLYIFIYTVFPKWVFPYNDKNKLIKDIMQRVNTELLGGSLQQHRVTLFKEVNYFNALIRNYIALVYHLFHINRWKAKLYFRILPRGHYLVVSRRHGLHCERSSTMFRIDKNNVEDNGIASYIRCMESSLHKPDLPEINDIDFKNIRSIREVAKNRRKEVARYMREGFIRDFNCLRLLHHKARHFYGTIITKKDGTPWGVLLVDSIGTFDPFTPIVRKRFDSFATTVCSIINMEA